jgi:hypothetical protein
MGEEAPVWSADAFGGSASHEWDLDEWEGPAFDQRGEVLILAHLKKGGDLTNLAY